MTSLDNQIAVLQAVKDGKKIQVRPLPLGSVGRGKGGYEWKTLNIQTAWINFAYFEYRVAPENQTLPVHLFLANNNEVYLNPCPDSYNVSATFSPEGKLIAIGLLSDVTRTTGT